MSKTFKFMLAGLIKGIESREGDIEKPRRGAPCKEGEEFMKDLGQLYRTFLMIECFQKFHTNGFNRTLSINKAIQKINELHPKMKGISASAFKKVLAKYHSTEGVNWLVEKKLEEVPVWEDAPLGSKIDKYETMEVSEFSIGEHPKYPKTPKRKALNFSKKRR